MKQLSDGSSDKELWMLLKHWKKRYVNSNVEAFEILTRWQRLQLSPHSDRPYTLDYIYAYLG